MSLYLLKYAVLILGGCGIGAANSERPLWVSFVIGIPFASFVSYIFHTHIL